MSLIFFINALHFSAFGEIFMDSFSIKDKKLSAFIKKECENYLHSSIIILRAMRNKNVQYSFYPEISYKFDIRVSKNFIYILQFTITFTILKLFSDKNWGNKIKTVLKKNYKWTVFQNAKKVRLSSLLDESSVYITKRKVEFDSKYLIFFTLICLLFNKAYSLI